MSATRTAVGVAIGISWFLLATGMTTAAGFLASLEFDHSARANHEKAVSIYAADCRKTMLGDYVTYKGQLMDWRQLMSELRHESVGAKTPDCSDVALMLNPPPKPTQRIGLILGFAVGVLCLAVGLPLLSRRR